MRSWRTTFNFRKVWREDAQVQGGKVGNLVRTEALSGVGGHSVLKDISAAFE